MTTHSPAAHAAGARPGKATLTDRYVHAVTRRIPEDQRDDVAEELRGSIADRVEALGHERPDLTDAAAEHAALEELGDPDRLAAGYTGRRLQLIGPELYPSYVRVLRSVLVSAVPSVAIVIAIVGALAGDSVGAVIGSTVWIAFTVAVQVAFWITLAFALTERGTSSDSLRSSMNVEWTPEQLPDLPQQARGSIGELVSSLVWLGLIGGAIVWQHYRSPVRDGDEHLPLLDPDLWSFWLPLILVLLVAEMVFEVVKYRAGRWSPTLATVNVVLAGVFAAPFVYLAATDQLLNPAAVAEIQEGWAGFDPGTANTVVIVTALVIWAWDSVDGWRRTRA